MRGKNIFVLIFLFLFLSHSSGFANDIVTDFLDNIALFGGTEIGAVNYSENEGGVASDWDSNLFKISLGLANQDRNQLEGEAKFSFFNGSSDTEEWKVDSVSYQTNDMDLKGWDFECKLGYAIDLGYDFPDLATDTELVFTPFLGYGYRNIRFSRSDFNILNLITITETVDEDYNIHHLNLGGRLDLGVNNDLNFSLGLLGGYVFYNEADNSALGKIKGDGGYLVRGLIGLDYAVSDSWRFLISFVSEQQSLRGGTKGNIIWPDNTLQSHGGFIKFTYDWPSVGPAVKRSRVEKKLVADDLKQSAAREERAVNLIEQVRSDYFLEIYKRLSERINQYADSKPVSVSGTVDLLMTISEDGYIRSLCTFSGNDELRKTIDDIFYSIPALPQIPQGLDADEISFKFSVIFG